MNRNALLRETRTLLAAAGCPEPGAEARLLVQHALNLDLTQLLAHGEQSVATAATAALSVLVARRCAGEPIAYLLGTREFWSLPLIVNRDCLIPRPETELLVERGLHHLPPGPAWVLDAGTGSGAIVLALQAERPELQAFACDRSLAALAVAAANARQLGLDLSLFCGHWLNAVAPAQRFDLIVSNPPYVAPGDTHLDRGDLRFEPVTALVAAEHGLAALRDLAEQARPRLRAGGWLILEHGMDQAEPVQALLREHGYGNIGSHRDLAGHLRCTEGQRG